MNRAPTSGFFFASFAFFAVKFSQFRIRARSAFCVSLCSLYSFWFNSLIRGRLRLPALGLRGESFLTHHASFTASAIALTWAGDQVTPRRNSAS